MTSKTKKTVSLIIVLVCFLAGAGARIAAVIANKASAVTFNRVVGVVLIVTSVVILTVNYLL